MFFFNTDDQAWNFSYIDLGLAVPDEGNEYYTKVIYTTNDGNYAYFSPSPQGYDPLGPFYGTGLAFLRLNLSNGQIKFILPPIGHFYSISFSPTGRRMIYTSFDQPLDLIIQDLQSGELKHIETQPSYTQAGEYAWSNDGLWLAYKLIVDGDECSRTFAIKLMNISDMSSTTIVQDTPVNTCQRQDSTYYITTKRLLLQATATPQP